MCRSPLAEISRSNTPWRATWSSMWSRKGTPVSIVPAPLPSRLILARIRVSLVSRVTSAVRLLILGQVDAGNYDRRRSRVEDRGECAQELCNFGGRSDRHAQAIREQRVRAVQVLDQNPALFQSAEDLVRFGYPEQYEIGFARVSFDPGQAPQLSEQPRALATNRRRLRFQHVPVLQYLGCRQLRQDIHIIR